MNADLSKITEAKVETLDAEAQGYIDRFDHAAQTWGWEADQGYGKRVDDAKAVYEQTKAELEMFILSLRKGRNNG